MIRKPSSVFVPFVLEAICNKSPFVLEYEFTGLYCRLVWCDGNSVTEYIYRYDNEGKRYVLLGVVTNDYSLAKVG